MPHVPPRPVGSATQPSRPTWSTLLRALREARGLSQDGWAAWLGVGTRTVQRWEAGTAVPDDAAERELLTRCREQGLFRAIEHSPPAGQTLTSERLSGLLAAARLSSMPPREALEPPTNLPAPMTRFIGREHDVADVRRLLGTTRLLTLTGAGGCGKTRLALHIATEVRAAYPDGVWLVELAPLQDPDLVASAVGAALGVRAAPGQHVADRLSEYLRSRAALLVLDNCEHLVAACAELAGALLSTCRELRILATSREVLGVAGETLWRVPSLAVPDARHPPPLERLAQCDAVRLFVERAQAVQPEFEVNEQTAPAVAQICQRLDGIPLALELAAARMKILSAAQLAARLKGRFRILASSSRTAPPRHRTLRATLDWSYDLLSDQERVLFARLWIFAGGFTLEAAEAVCIGGGIWIDDILDLLERLVDKSLVVVQPVVDTPRYRLLETLREYANERLQPTEVAALQRQHAIYYVALAERAEPELRGPTQVMWFEWVEREHDNFRAALGWQIASAETEIGLRLASALARFWLVRGHLTEGRRWLDALLALPSTGETDARGRALAEAGLLARSQADYGVARALYEQCRDLWRKEGNKHGIAQTLRALGMTAAEQGHYAAARAFLDESLTIVQGPPDWRATVTANHILAKVAVSQNDYAAARALLEQSLALWRSSGDWWGIASALHQLGLVATEQGDYAFARAFLAESLAVKREIGYQIGIARSLVVLGRVAQTQGDNASARALYEESLMMLEQLGEQRVLAEVLEGLAGLAARIRPGVAARLAGRASALREAVDASLTPVEQARLDGWLAPARETLGDEARSAAEAEARSMPLSEVIASGLAEARAGAGSD